MISLTVRTKEAGDRLDAVLAQAKNPKGILLVAGREVANRLKAHFRGRDKTPNQLGGKRTHWWLEVMRSVQVPVVKGNDSVVVSINHPAFAQKVFGGKIEAKRGKALTIPVSPEAHGRTVDTLEHEKGILLFVLGKKDGKPGVLAEPSTTRGIVVHYVLRPSVFQEPDPEALPPFADSANAAATRAEAALTREIEKS